MKENGFWNLSHFVQNKVVYISFSQHTDFDIDLTVQKHIPVRLLERTLSCVTGVFLSLFLYSGWKAGTLKPSIISIDFSCFHHWHQWLVLNIEPIFYWLYKLLIKKSYLINCIL